MPKLTDTRRAKIVDSLICNCTCDGSLKGDSVWEEGDREALASLPDEKLEGMETQLKAAVKNELTINAMPPWMQKRMNGETAGPMDEEEEVVEEEVVEEEVVEEEEEPIKPIKPIKNENLTVEQWLAKSNAPPAIVAMVRNSEKQSAREKIRLIKVVSAHKGNILSHEKLAAMTVNQLKPLAAIAVGGKQNNYVGAAAPLGIAINEDDDDEQGDMLVAPTINWGAEAAAKRAS